MNYVWVFMAGAIFGQVSLALIVWIFHRFIMRLMRQVEEDFGV